MARALAALEREGLRRVPGPDLRLEYPIATGEAGTLLLGYLDLLAAKDGGVVVVDFKTDAPPKGTVADGYPAYVEQVREYGRILVKLARGCAACRLEMQVRLGPDLHGFEAGKVLLASSTSTPRGRRGGAALHFEPDVAREGRGAGRSTPKTSSRCASTGGSW